MPGPALRIPIEIDSAGAFQSFKKNLDSAHESVESATKHMGDDFKNINPDAKGLFDRFTKEAEPAAKESGTQLGIIFAAAIGAGIVGVGTRLLAAVNSLAKIGDLA